MILTQCREYCKFPVHQPNQSIPFLSSAKGLGLLRRLQRVFIFVPVDKAGNNIACVCRRLYCQILRHELETTATYELSKQEEKKIIGEHVNFLKPFNLAPSTSEQNLPYLYWIPKMHKKGCRFIAGSSSWTTTKASRVLSSILHLVLKTLRKKADEGITATGVRQFFVIDSHIEMVRFLRFWKRDEDHPEDNAHI